MDSISKYFIGLVAVIALVVGSVAAFRPVNVTVTMPDQKYGATPGGDFQNPSYFTGGVTNGTSVSTSSQGTAITVKGTEFTAWANSSVVSYFPGLVAGGTLTLPASSTISAIVPKAGDRQSFCFRNATSTAGVPVTFAGALGTKLLVASSSATAVGSSVVMTGKIGCFTLIRETASSTANDIDALLTVFQ